MYNLHKVAFEAIKALVESQLGQTWADYNNDGGGYERQANLYRLLADLFIDMAPTPGEDNE